MRPAAFLALLAGRRLKAIQAPHPLLVHGDLVRREGSHIVVWVTRAPLPEGLRLLEAHDLVQEHAVRVGIVVDGGSPAARGPLAAAIMIPMLLVIEQPEALGKIPVAAAVVADRAVPDLLCAVPARALVLVAVGVTLGLQAPKLRFELGRVAPALADRGLDAGDQRHGAGLQYGAVSVARGGGRAAIPASSKSRKRCSGCAGVAAAWATRVSSSSLLMQPPAARRRGSGHARTPRERREGRRLRIGRRARAYGMWAPGPSAA